MNASAISGKISASPVLVSDFDGTMTRHDFYQLVRARWWNDAEPDPWKDYLAGRLTHFDALNRFFARIRTDERGLEEFIQGMELDPTLPEALARLHQRGWRVVIASAGCSWYIERLLARVRVPFELHANPGRFSPERGLEMIWPTDSPFFSPKTGIDKPGVVRHALAGRGVVAFAGDGPPDVPAAKLVPSDLCFARGTLAESLTREGESFQPLTNWAALADALLEDPVL